VCGVDERRVVGQGPADGDGEEAGESLSRPTDTTMWIVSTVLRVRRWNRRPVAGEGGVVVAAITRVDAANRVRRRGRRSS
jgi:hypothetical protein